MNKIDFFNHSLDSLRQIFKEIGEKPFRAEQLFRWVYVHHQFDPNQMQNMTKEFRSKIPELFDFSLPEVIEERISVDGTKKYLMKLKAGHTIETVLIPSKKRRTLCVSSQVGCNMACQFCYTGKQKLKYRLSPSEIVGQFMQVQLRQPEDEPITNIVFMGMGEPLDSPESVFSAIKILHEPNGLNLSKKKITVSTSGLVDKIPLVTEAGVRLAVSLNATTDETRTKIMPINKKWPIADLLEACREHARRSKDKVTLEYVLLKGVTDSIEDAERLVKITRNVPSKLNIIPFNEHPGSGFYRPDEEVVQAFHERLMELGAHVLRRRTMGRDIYAACGQLTSAHIHKQQNSFQITV